MDANYLLAIFIGVYLLQTIFASSIELINTRYGQQRGGCLPFSFQGFVDSSKLSDILAYTVEKSRLGLSQGILSDCLLLAFILIGIPAKAESFIIEQQMPYLAAGLFFFLCPALLLFLVELPFDYYNTFVIEEKFGFNRSSLKVWIIDHVKAGLLSIVVFSILLSAILALIRAFPNEWWLWGFIIVSFVQVLLAVLYPKIIAPLFNKFKPIQDELLSKKIARLMEDNGIRVKKILQMDAGVRSRHTNAYFTGLGKTKQIVLYDTLIDSHPHDEILSILAHEIGHFKKKHILKQLLIFEASMLVGFYATSMMLDWPLLYSAFGLMEPRPYVGLFFISLFWQKAGYFLQPLYMALSRYFERQADQFSVRLLKTGKPLATSLKRMASDNLSNLTPHPLYVWFNYSHPPLVERVMALEEAPRPEARRAGEGKLRGNRRSW